MAIPKHRTDLWAHVQESTFQREHQQGAPWRTPQRPSSNVRVLPTPRTVHISDQAPTWHDPRRHHKADELLGALESAVTSGRARKSSRLRAAWLHQVQLDRIAATRQVAHERGLRLDPIGRGPIFDRPTVHYRDRLPWGFQPLDRLMDGSLPERATTVISAWNGSGRLFDAFYVADEPATPGQLPTKSLIGAVSADGRSAEWFVLDRWAS